jgi:signal transduction histidine kinase
VCNLIFDTLFSSWIYIYGHNDLSVPLQAAFLLVMAYFATVLCKNYRNSVVALIASKQRNDQFLAIASHELRTPLTSMKGYTEVLERRLKRSNQTELVTYTTKLDDQLSKVTGLIRDLLDVSKIQSGQLQMRRERLSINSVVEQSIEEVQALAHHHRIVVTGWSNTPVSGDPVRLCQVLTNLLSNAIKYSPTSDRVIVRVSEARDKVIVSVQDFGIGVPAKERTTIFEPYFRSQHTQREDVPGGLGMGLYIAQEIVRWHGGRIWLDSEEEKGSTFSFLLPLFKETADVTASSHRELPHV